jgi:ribosome-binding protein aMBF1 (putative translation factor)
MKFREKLEKFLNIKLREKKLSDNILKFGQSQMKTIM